MADEFICDAPEVRDFIGNVQRIVAHTATVEDRLAAIRPFLKRLLEQRKWLFPCLRNRGLRSLQASAPTAAGSVPGTSGKVPGMGLRHLTLLNSPPNPRRSRAGTSR